MSDGNATLNLTQAALFQDLLRSEQALRAAVEAELRATRAALETAAQELAGEALDAWLKRRAQGLHTVPAAELSTQIIQQVRRDLATAGQRDAHRELVLLRQRNADLETQLAAARAAPPAPALPASPAELPVRLPAAPPLPLPSPPPAAPYSLTFTPPAAPESAAPPVTPLEPAAEPATWPGWFREWVKTAGYKNDAWLVRVLGETGEPRRVRAMELAAAQLGMTSNAGGLGRGFERLTEQGIILTERAAITTRTDKRRLAFLVGLTPEGPGINGQDAYRLLTGTDPVPQDLLRLKQRHKVGNLTADAAAPVKQAHEGAIAHLYLMLETEEILTAAGYTVTRFPEAIYVPELGTYEPDLTATYGEQTCYIECERGGVKKPAERRNKFARYYAVTGGTFWIVADVAATAAALTSEITFFAGTLGPVTLHLLVTGNTGRKEIPRGLAVWETRQIK